MLEDELIEREAVALLLAAGLDPELCNCPIGLALRLGVPVRDAGPVRLPGDAFAVVSDDSATIYVRASVAARRRAFAAAHELAEVALARAGYDEPDREDVANRFGAAILLPRPCVIRALRGQAWRGVRDFARRLGVSATCAALRLGEATGDPVAVVDRSTVRLRGAPWPFRESPGRLARARKVPQGIFRYALDRQRVAVGAA